MVDLSGNGAAVSMQSKRDERVAQFPLKLHVMAYSTLSLMLAGVIDGGLMVLFKWQSMSKVADFTLAWLVAGVFWYWARLGWYATRLRLEERRNAVQRPGA